jgi:hypothetical protein
MGAFRTFLAVVFICVGVYTANVILKHGWNLFPAFFGDMVAMTWAGQFNADFMSFLCLSGLWVAWRHHFSRGGLLLGVVAFFGGIMFLAPYLVFTSFKTKGDMRALLLGKERALSEMRM